MKNAAFLPRIADRQAPDEERLALIAHFVLGNGLPGPVELLDIKQMPKGYVFRVWMFRDVAVVLAFTNEEAAASPTSAAADSAQMWQFDLTESGGRPRLTAEKSGVICTLAGALTVVRSIDDGPRAKALLEEWTIEPPTEVEVMPAMDEVH